MASPTMPMAPVPAVDPAQATIMTPYHAHGSAVQGYPRVPPSASARGEPPIPPPSQISSTRSPLGLNRPPPTYLHPMPSAPPTQRAYPRATSTSPTLTSSSRLSDSRAPVSRRASLSLAAITTPFTPEAAPYSQSKNLRAQTLPLLGQRLRLMSAVTGPAEEIHLRASKYIRTAGASRVVAQRRAIIPRHKLRRLSRNTLRSNLISPPASRQCIRRHTLLDIPTNDIPVISVGMLTNLVQERLVNDTSFQQ